MFDNLIKYLQNFAQSAILVIQTTLKQYNKDATGVTSRSLKEATRFISSNAVSTQVTGSTVFNYIESGRRAGAKMPPEDALIEWMKARSIPAAASFAIRKSIAEKGIEPTPVLKMSFAKLQQTLLPKLKAEILQEIANGVVSILQKQFKG